MNGDRVAIAIPLLMGLLLGEGARRVERVALPADFGRVRMSNMRKAAAMLPQLLADKNVRAFLRVLREGESHQGGQAYLLMNGGQYFSAPPWVHPRRVFKGGSTDAAGAYQICGGGSRCPDVWGEVAGQMGLRDFSPENQDAAAVGRIAYRGALPAVLVGKLDLAFSMLENEWTSLPGAKENKKLTRELAGAVFAKYGGIER